MISRVLLRRAAVEAKRSARDLSRTTYRSSLTAGSGLQLSAGQENAVSLLLRAFATTAAAPKKTTATKKTSTGKTAKKTTKKTTKKSTATKKKKKPAKKPVKKRKVLTEKQKEAKAKKDELAKTKELKQQALVGEKLDVKPDTAWKLFVKQQAGGKSGTPISQVMGELSSSFKNLSAAERESLNHQANQNRTANQTVIKRWVQSKTPLQIHEANRARKRLNRLSQKTGKTKRKYRMIPDDREVLGPRTSYIIFSRDRRQSGDFVGISLSDSAKRIAHEFKQLSAAERKKYDDLASQDRARYTREYKQAYGKEPPAPRRKSS